MAKEPGLEASLWSATAEPAPDAPPLDGDARADVAIVGAGFTGCSAALHLAERGARVLTLEASEVGWGGSGRNMGLVNAGLWLDPDEVERRVGPAFGPRLVEVLGRAPELVASLIERLGIACDVVRKGVIRAGHSPAGFAALEGHAAQWRGRGANVEILDRDRTAEMLGTPRYHGAIIDHRSFAIQPLSYARGLARAARSAGARIHGRTRVGALSRQGGTWRLATDRGAVTADSVILATNAYSLPFAGPNIRDSIVPIGCFAYATEPLSDNVRGLALPAGHAMYDSQPAMGFARLDRDNRLIFGSLGYLPRGGSEGRRSWPSRTLRALFPDLPEQRLEFEWAGTIGFTTDHIPRYHEPGPGLYAACGYNGRGIAPGTMWGKMLAERALGGRAEDMPLPVTTLRPTALRGLRIALYESAFRAYRLRSLFD